MGEQEEIGRRRRRGGEPEVAGHTMTAPSLHAVRDFHETEGKWTLPVVIYISN